MAKRWKIPRQSLTVLAAVLAVGVVGACFFVGKARERKPIVSKVVAGYRCRYTLSPDWTTRIDREMDEIIASLHLEKVAEPSGGKQ